MCKIVVKEVAILEAISFSKVFMHFKSTQWP
jgi:hypothetical protein